MSWNWEDPPEPDYSDLEWCSDCRSPIFDDGCDCKAYCKECHRLFSKDIMTFTTDGKMICVECVIGDEENI